MITVKNLSISFKNHQVVRSISFALSAQKITALVGQSGSGKSTVALAIINLLRGAQISGEIFFNEKNLLQLSEKELQKVRGKEIGIIFQDPNISLNPLHKIGKQIEEAITIHNPKISKKDLQNRVAELLKMVELESLESRLDDYPFQLSGGQKQRVMISIALANNPKILIADEPTTALDVTVQNEILNLILRLKNELGISVLFITHNLRAVRKIADQVLEMKDGEIVNSDKFLVDSCRLLANSNSNLFSLTTNNQQLTTILKVSNLAVFYKKNKIISDLNFSLNSGENLGVIGESGSGKSTLARALIGLIKSQGEIKFFGEKNWQKNSFDLRREVQIVFQDPFGSLDPRMTVQQIIEEGLIIHNLTPHSSLLTPLLQKLHLSTNLLSRYPHQLSGGQRQRVAIARALILNPKILILDEPTSALDTSTQNEIIKLLFEIQSQQKISYILISHDLEVVSQIADEIMVLKAGQIVEMGKKSDLIHAPTNPYTKTLLSNFI